MSDRGPTPTDSPPPETASSQAPDGDLSRAVGRGLVWGVLLAALVVVALIALRGDRRSAPPPVLGTPLTEVVPGLELTNRDGRTVHLGDLAGRPWVADLIFTRCALACPRMSARMAQLDRELPEEIPLVSVSVDPSHDTPERLAEYAAKHDAGERWLFLTGDEETIRTLALDGLKLGVGRDEQATEPGLAITHSDRFVLLDGRARPRGYYDPFESPPGGLEKLRRDLEAL